MGAPGEQRTQAMFLILPVGTFTSSVHLNILKYVAPELYLPSNVLRVAFVHYKARKTEVKMIFVTLVT